MVLAMLVGMDDNAVNSTYVTVKLKGDGLGHVIGHG
jgi:hypothetical protein